MENKLLSTTKTSPNEVKKSSEKKKFNFEGDSIYTVMSKSSEKVSPKMTPKLSPRQTPKKNQKRKDSANTVDVTPKSNGTYVRTLTNLLALCVNDHHTCNFFCVICFFPSFPTVFRTLPF